MQKIRTISFILLFLLAAPGLKAQILNVPNVPQQESEWCWSACSDCILQFLGDTVGGDTSLSQCTIAEYVRSVDTATFGTLPCCQYPFDSCNNPNFLYGSSGSIQDIFMHFKQINSIGMATDLNIDSIRTQIGNGAPFIIRWGWYSGGGHFLVGHGIIDSSIYYMNPLEGLEIGDYNWMVNDTVSHLWNFTLVLDTSTTVTGINKLPVNNNHLSIYPNPTSGEINITSTKPINMVTVTNLLGQVVLKSPSENSGENQFTFELKEEGMYFVTVVADGETTTEKVVVSK